MAIYAWMVVVNSRLFRGGTRWLAFASALLAVGLSGCAHALVDTNPTVHTSDSPAGLEDCTGVSVVIDSKILQSAGSETAYCIDTEQPIVAGEALKKVGVKVEGTKQYADQVICRVNGVPTEKTAITTPHGAYHETCATMPAAFAYWAIWVKPGGEPWAYALEGLSSQKLKPGDIFELLFTVNNQPESPDQILTPVETLPSNTGA